MTFTATSTRTVSGNAVTIYETMDSADTNPSVITAGGGQSLAGAIQVVGTMGGATVNLQVSNNGTDFYNLKDVEGNVIALTTSNTGAEFSTAAVYLRPLVVGGSGSNITVLISLRG